MYDLDDLFPLRSLGLDVSGIDLDDPYGPSLLMARIAKAWSAAMMESCMPQVAAGRGGYLAGRAHALADVGRLVENTIWLFERLRAERAADLAREAERARLEEEPMLPLEQTPPEPEMMPWGTPLGAAADTPGENEVEPDTDGRSPPPDPGDPLEPEPAARAAPPSTREGAPALAAAARPGSVIWDFASRLKSSASGAASVEVPWPTMPPEVGTWRAEAGDVRVGGVLPRVPERRPRNDGLHDRRAIVS